MIITIDDNGPVWRCFDYGPTEVHSDSELFDKVLHAPRLELLARGKKCGPLSRVLRDISKWNVIVGTARQGTFLETSLDQPHLYFMLGAELFFTATEQMSKEELFDNLHRWADEVCKLSLQEVLKEYPEVEDPASFSIQRPIANVLLCWNPEADPERYRKSVRKHSDSEAAPAPLE